MIYYTEYPKGSFHAANDVETLKNKALVVYKQKADTKLEIIKQPEVWILDCKNLVQLSSGKIAGSYKGKHYVSYETYKPGYIVVEGDIDPMVNVTDSENIEYLEKLVDKLIEKVDKILGIKVFTN